MKKITPQFMPYVEQAPHFVEAVKRAQQEKTTVRESLETFRDDPFLLYACLWFAYSKRVPVLFEAPQAGRRPRRQ